MNANPPLTQLGRYRIVKVLGRGAMGVVYEGLDPRLERPVAIKTILKGHLLDETLADEYSARFVREAQAAARLNHPNIVTVFDFGEQGDVAYLVMEFIRGHELAEAFDRSERFALPEAIRIMGELLDALAYAHAQGVVHRDVKPANVMIDAGGRVKLTDFGVARLADANQDRTAPGTMVGTPSYMSPEQIQGLPVGSRADLFAAGIILYQFLTGQRPFAGGGSFAIQKQIVHDDPEPPSRRNPVLPPVFDAIVARALAKSPDDRYESAAMFAAALRAVPLPEPDAAPTRAEGLPDPDATVIRSLAPAPAVAAPAVGRGVPTADRTERQAPAPAAAIAPGGPRRRRMLTVGGALGAGALVAWFVIASRPPAPQPTPAPSRAEPVAVPLPTAPVAILVAPPSASAAPAAPASAPAKVAAPRVAASTPTIMRTKPPKPSSLDERGVAASAKRADSRCGDLLTRMQLGEPLSPDGQAFFDKECKR